MLSLRMNHVHLLLTTTTAHLESWQPALPAFFFAVAAGSSKKTERNPSHGGCHLLTVPVFNSRHQSFHLPKMLPTRTIVAKEQAACP